MNCKCRHQGGHSVPPPRCFDTHAVVHVEQGTVILKMSLHHAFLDRNMLFKFTLEKAFYFILGNFCDLSVECG
jgi:hypothetical protein